MEALNELIDKRISEFLKKSNCITSLPCRVIEDLQNGYYTVEVLSNGTKYIVPNFSGSAINVGENVQLYYKGAIVTNQSAYIGAVNYKDSGASPIVVNGLNTLGEIIRDNTRITIIKFKATQSVNLLIVFNANVFGTIEGDCSLDIYIDESKISHVPRETILQDKYNLVCFTLPLFCESGEHELKILANGTGNYINICSYIYGFYIEELPIFDPTSDEDYVYETIDNKSNSIFYKGETITPSVPTLMGGKDTTIIRATTFNTSNVLGVYIPEGITEIE